MQKVAILLTIKNGDKYLNAQLKSLIEQKKVKIDIYASDDGSTDNSLKLINKFKNIHKNKIKKIYKNNFKSAAKNFHFLINKVNTSYDYYAFSDQDDIWKKNKISNAIKMLEKGYDLYGSRTILIDEFGKKIGKSLNFNKKPSFKNALVQNIAGGNTMVFSKKLFRDIQNLRIKDSPSHDWFVYIYSSFKGYFIYYDHKPSIYYRQHKENYIGSNLGLLNQIKRIIWTFRGRFRKWNNFHEKLINKFFIHGNEKSKQNFLLFQKCRKSRIFF